MSVGERLRAARRMARMSQEKLARQVGVTKQSISKYEKDAATPGSAILLALARALSVPVDFFLRPRPMPRLSEAAYRAHRSKLGKRKLEAIKERVREWLERYLELENLVPASQRPRFKLPRGTRWRIRSADDAEAAALELRKQWGLGVDAIESLVEVLEANGIKVGMIHSESALDGLTLWADDDLPVIVVNGDVPGDRQRLTLAHELGHLMLDVASAVDEEKVAFRFAGAFLVPQPTVLRELGEERRALGVDELYLLKHKYGLSMQAWIYRAFHLGIISPRLREQMVRSFRRRGWHKREPGDQCPPERSKRMRKLTAMALAEEYVSRPRAAELLGILPRDVDLCLPEHHDAPTPRD